MQRIVASCSPSASWCVAALLLGAAVLLIFNTIRTAMFARRREIEVMKLVGATNWFIRVPFMLEGLLQGLIGSAVAYGIAVFFRKVWFDSFSGQSTATLFDTIRWTNGQFTTVTLIVVAIGALVGSLGAFISTTWYLRV